MKKEIESKAKEIIERIWDRLYGDLRCKINSDQLCEVLQEAKLSIIAALNPTNIN